MILVKQNPDGKKKKKANSALRHVRINFQSMMTEGRLNSSMMDVFIIKKLDLPKKSMDCFLYDRGTVVKELMLCYLYSS